MKLSVIICTYNREKYIISAIKSIADQDCDRSSYELIVVDNNSTDNTFSLCQDFQRESGFTFSLLKETRQGLSYARNTGIKNSKSNIVTFIDDDAIATKGFVNEIINAFEEDSRIKAAGGKVIPSYPDGKEPAWLSPYIIGIVSKVDLGNEKKYFDFKYPVGCNMSFRKESLLKIGGFNEELKIRSDDKDIFLRLNLNKNEVLYLPNAKVDHHIDASRITLNGVKKVSRSTGESEFFRGKGKFYKAGKFLEYVFKLKISFLIAFLFVFKLQFSKAYYLIIVRWQILKGFLNAKV